MILEIERDEQQQPEGEPDFDYMDQQVQIYLNSRIFMIR